MIDIKTKKSKEVIDITSLINDQIEQKSTEVKAVLLFAQHTTCALTVADLDPGTDNDYLKAFENMIPKLNYNHPHDPSHVGDHILSAAIGPSLILPIINNELRLGTWQSVVLLEFNGPKTRKIMVTFL